MTDKDQNIANDVGQRLGRFLLEMQEETGWPTWLIFAGVHGHITALMVQNMGPQDAAAICERAAQRMRGFSSLAEMALAGATPAGQA